MTVSGRKALLLGDIEHASQAWQQLSDRAELVQPLARTRAPFIKECQAGRLDGVEVIFRTFMSVNITGRFDEELLQALPKSVKFICHNGAGYDQIDIDACTARNVRVSNVPRAVIGATADTTMFLILGALRGFNAGMMALREKAWRGRPPASLGHEPKDKVLGILGMGGIGRNVRDKAQAFGMKVQYFNRQPLKPDLAGDAKYVDFEELLRTSDVISLNLPLNHQTFHIISTEEFQKMKTGVVIVNTARGAAMDEDALVRALDDGKVFSCGLDVYEHEPTVHPGLIAHPNVMLIPHMGTWTYETQVAMELSCIENVRCALEMGKLVNPVSEQAHLP